jgi:hypothetical protein
MKPVAHRNFQKEYLELFERFMNYLTLYKSDVALPHNASIIFFDQHNDKLSKYSLWLQSKLLEKDPKTPIIEVTKTGSKRIPWRIAQNI